MVTYPPLVSGSYPRTIEIIFLIWILPIVEYGSVRLKHLCLPQISVTQSGGLSRNGNVQQLIRVVESIEGHLSVPDFWGSGEETPVNVVILALLDCSKAFDRMFRPLLFQKLRNMGVENTLFRFLVSYFHSRCQRVCVDESFSDYVETVRGGPQGSVIVLFS